MIATLRYTLVNNQPREAFSVQLDDKGVLIQPQIDDNERRSSRGEEDLRRYWSIEEDFPAR